MKAPSPIDLELAGTPVLLPSFWMAQSGWPRGDDRHVFLGKAIHLVGQAKHGGEWTGREVTARRALPDFPPRPAFSPDAEALAAKRRRQLDLPPLPAVPNLHDDHVHALHWERARLRYARYRAEVEAALGRLLDVLDWVGNEALNGRLDTVFRAVRGGQDFFAGPPSFWNIEPLERERFRACQCMLQQPGGLVPTPVYIFFTRSSVASAIEQIKPPEPSKKRGYAAEDADLLKEMDDLIRQGSTLRDASLALAGRAVGGGEDESRAKRLYRGYQKQYGSAQR